MRIVALVTFALLAAGCRAQARPPEIPRGDPAAAEQVYADHALSFRGGWSNKWYRADGGYYLDDVRPAVDVYPESRAARKRATRRQLVVFLLAGTAGAILGTTAGHQLTAADADQLSTREAGALYATGGLFAAFAFVLDWSWGRRAYEDLASTYNRALRDDLSRR